MKNPGRVAGGHARAAKLSPEQRSEQARRASVARWNGTSKPKHAMVTIALGALSRGLNEQLKRQGLAVAESHRNSLVLLQGDADAITRLRVHGYISETAAGVAHRRLLRGLLNLKLVKVE